MNDISRVSYEKIFNKFMSIESCYIVVFDQAFAQSFNKDVALVFYNGKHKIITNSYIGLRIKNRIKTSNKRVGAIVDKEIDNTMDLVCTDDLVHRIRDILTDNNINWHTCAYIYYPNSNRRGADQVIDIW